MRPPRVFGKKLSAIRFTDLWGQGQPPRAWNAFAAVKAIAAALALHGDARDSAIATMRQTGADMQSKYKETSRAGLAVNFVEC